MTIRNGLAALALAVALVWPLTAVAAYAPPESEIDPEVLRVNEQGYLGVKVNATTPLIDAEGNRFTLGDLRDKAVVLVLSYYSCDGFCPAYNANLMSVLAKVNEMARMKAGEDFRVVTISFDKNDDTAAAALFEKQTLNLPEDLAPHWKVATFENKEELKPFTDAIGFKFFWSRPDHMFFHPNAYYFISPDEGRVARIMHGSTAEARDMELALLDAKFKRIKPSEALQLAVSLCYSYNYKDGKYGLNYPAFFAFGSLFIGLTAFAVAARHTKKMTKKQD
jgi:protein SCO1/2